MLRFPEIDPIAFRLGPLAVHWYALTYLIGFGLGYWLLLRRLKHQPYARITQPAPWTRESVEDLLLTAILGVILGGRLGYCLFYKPAYYLANPLDILKVWEGGMSFHGGAIGVVVGLAVYAWRRKRPFLEVTDLLVPAVPTGLAAGRIGNFLNGELWGRPADPSLPWAMIFPGAGPEPRHPSQLYQFLGEGLLLFVLLWLYARKERARGEISGAFVFGYGVFRFAAEYFREPDDYLGLLSLGLSMGQWLCVPMIIGGAALWLWSRKRNAHPPLDQDPARSLSEERSDDPARSLSEERSDDPARSLSEEHSDDPARSLSEERSDESKGS
ncbi:prolipoprotein diacylglyceryl transferase [Enemella evansiae]|uniref:prolipoprotein diacylglyceryl transferase n=1 Tax=Enemella evansiae TaxID=2016499 RepID=UPI000B964C2A|nr:prolipoprotein diacylglyceryl transferase [Enemella evansiae]OYO19608.1 prolipoprotein diacylglyceryl transferase [Enemella evansiae]